MYHYLAWDLPADQQHLSLPICFPVYTQSHIPDSKLGVEELKTPAHPTPSHACGTGTSCLSSHSLWYFSLESQNDTTQCCAHIPNHFQRISDHSDALHIFMPVTPYSMANYKMVLDQGSHIPKYNSWLRRGGMMCED